MAVARRAHPTDTELELARDLLAVTPHLGKLAWRAAGECTVGSPERSRLLFVLAQAPQRPGHLAQVLNLSAGTVSELIDALVAEGLVRRQADPDDRRAVVLELTAEGRRQREHHERAAAALLAHVVGRLTPAQQRRVRAAFTDIRDAFIAVSREDATARSGRTSEKLHAR